jgi:protein-tyrosine phosphatase
MFDYSQILPELWVGAHPRGPKDIDRLQRRTAVTAVLSLQTDEDMTRLGLNWEALAAHYEQRGMTAERVPVIDFDQVDLRIQLPLAAQTLNRLIGAGHTTYVHCTLGVGRAPSVVIAYLAWYREWALDKAWYRVKELRECAPSFEAVWLASRERGARMGG